VLWTQYSCIGIIDQIEYKMHLITGVLSMCVCCVVLFAQCTGIKLTVMS